MPMKADHFAFSVSDMDRAVKFYRDILELPVLFVEEDHDHNEKFAFLQLEGGNLELLGDLKGTLPPNPPKFLHCPHLAFNVPDMNAFCKKLAHASVSYEGPFLIPRKVTWMYFKDPDGNALEACQWLS
jgi:catechol 2,3-dioxygenase-like lactoylglutathione lyase family enzyme